MSAAHSLIAVGTRVFRLPGFITSPITPITIIFIYESFVYCISYIMPIFFVVVVVVMQTCLLLLYTPGDADLNPR